MHMFHDGGGFMAGMHFLWWLFWIALIGVIVYIGWGRQGGQGQLPRESPHEVLRRRLASGEITPGQYEERKGLLDRDAAGKG